MNKKYRLKPYDKVVRHHYITKKTWDELADSPELSVRFLDGIFGKTALIAPKGIDNIDDTYMVDVDDLYEVKETPVEKAPNPTELKPKTYTLDDIRKASVRAMRNEYIDNEDSAIVTALTLAKLINELN